VPSVGLDYGENDSKRGREANCSAHRPHFKFKLRLPNAKLFKASTAVLRVRILVMSLSFFFAK